MDWEAQDRRVELINNTCGSFWSRVLHTKLRCHFNLSWLQENWPADSIFHLPTSSFLSYKTSSILCLVHLVSCFLERLTNSVLINRTILLLERPVCFLLFPWHHHRSPLNFAGWPNSPFLKPIQWREHVCLPSVPVLNGCQWLLETYKVLVWHVISVCVFSLIYPPPFWPPDQKSFPHLSTGPHPPQTHWEVKATICLLKISTLSFLFTMRIIKQS